MSPDLDKDPYHPTIRGAMNVTSIGGYVAIYRTSRSFTKFFRVTTDPKWGKRLDPVETLPEGVVAPIVMLD